MHDDHTHYDDGLEYDLNYRRYREDLLFYLSYYADVKEALELGVGTGRIAIEAANAGTLITGIEASSAMLARAEEKLAVRSKQVRSSLKLIHGDMKNFDLARTFPLITAPFNAWMHLYSDSDLRDAFACVKKHLAPNGRFIFDVLYPDLKFLSRDPERIYRCGVIKRNGVRYRHSERYDYDPVAQIQQVTIHREAEDDTLRATFPAESSTLRQRYFFPRELVTAINSSGFKIERRFGSFDRSPLFGDSESQIFILRHA